MRGYLGHLEEQEGVIGNYTLEGVWASLDMDHDVGAEAVRVVRRGRDADAA